MFDNPFVKKTPKDPLGSDLGKIILMGIMFLVCLGIRRFSVAFIFLGLMIFWIWHRRRLKKKFEDAIEKRRNKFAELYGYEDGYGGSDTEAPDEDYF